MNLISFLILLIFYDAYAFNLDEYFQNSIIRRIRDKKLSFESYIQYVSDKNMESITKEKHSFKYNRGESIMVEKYKEDRKKDYDHIHRLLYLNDLNNAYVMDSDSTGIKKCNHIELNEKIIDYYTKNWLPNDAFELIDKSNNLVLSKSILLFALIDYYDKKEAIVKCEDLFTETRKENTKICELILKDKLKIEYKFEDKDQFTMYPFELSTYEKKDDKWQLYIKYYYHDFIPSFENEDFTLDLRLPTGFGCNRIDSIDKFPKIKTIYGNKFNIEFDVDFEYRNSKSSNTQYSIKMFVDKNNQLIIADGINEITNDKITTYYNITKNTLYEISLKNDYCFSFNLNSQTELNWYYIQDLFTSHPQFFNINNDYTYIGDYNCNPKGLKPCLIFEKIFKDFNKVGSDRKNQIYDGFLRKKKNSMKSDNVVVTHYYSNEQDFRNDDNHSRIPYKIEIRLREDNLIETNKITIKFTSFTLNPDDRTFVTKCIRNDELDDERKKLEKEKLELKLERERLEEEKAEFEKEKNSNIIEEYEIEIGELRLEKNYTIVKNN